MHRKNRNTGLLTIMNVLGTGAAARATSISRQARKDDIVQISGDIQSDISTGQSTEQEGG
jgi:hypothetical protein